MGDTPSRQVQQCHLALQRAMRLAEQGKNIVFVMDSMISLGLAYRDDAEQQGKMGAISISISSLKSIFGKARILERGGSLTVVGVSYAGESPLHGRIEFDLKPLLSTAIKV